MASFSAANCTYFVPFCALLPMCTIQSHMLPVLCGCETWSATMGEEHRLRVLREICGAGREKVKGGDWRKVRNEELHDLYCSPGIFRVITLWRMTWVVGHVARMGKREIHTRFW